MQKIEINKTEELIKGNGALTHKQKAGTIVAHRQAVERVIAKVQGNLSEPFSVQEMAQIANISPFHFNRVFHQITGLPPAQFLYALRLDEAKRLLLTTDCSVTDVCFEVGYNSLGTFTTRFTQLVGVSPSRLRQMADRMTPAAISSLINVQEEIQTTVSRDSCVTGRITTPVSFSDSIFVGLFQDVIPQGRPIAGTLLAGPGNFQIGPMPDGCYYAFAATLPVRSAEPLDYFLPRSSSLLVGTGLGPVIVRNGRAGIHTEIHMRLPSITDPPILVALPSLLAR